MRLFCLGEGKIMKLSKVIAIPAIALAAGISLAGCGSHPAVHHTHSTTHPTPNSTKPDTMISAPGAPMIPTTHGGAAGLVTAGTQYSLNWSGYAATGKETSVSSAWTVPSVSCPTAQLQYSAFWVGLDGLKDSTVEQDGTISGCYGSAPFYYAWYEMYPAGMVAFSNPVYPGDHFTASVSVNSGKYYTLVISDSTRKWSHTVKVTKSGLADSSAEVIAEAPSSTSGILPLADFHNVYFSEDHVNGRVMGDYSLTTIAMLDNSGLHKDNVSGTSDVDQKFSVSWARSS